MQAAHTITWLAKHWRLPVGPPPTTPVVVTDPSLSSTLDHCGTQWHKLGGRVGDTAASKELWGAGVRSTKATQLHSIGQLAGWVGSCVLGTAKHRSEAGHGQPAYYRQSNCLPVKYYFIIFEPFTGWPFYMAMSDLSYHLRKHKSRSVNNVQKEAH